MVAEIRKTTEKKKERNLATAPMIAPLVFHPSTQHQESNSA